jgi:hypothetical protein
MNSRATDPITSKLASLEAEDHREANEQKVLEILSRCLGGLTAYELSEALNAAYVSISPLLRPMCKRGLIHEGGTRRNSHSGARAIVWLPGPSPDYIPGHSLPTRQTGPRKDIRQFTPDDIEQLNTEAKKDLVRFTELLNYAIRLRMKE